MSDFLEMQPRRKIYTLIVKNPGVHLSKIAELLNMPITEVESNLYYLEKNKNIIATTKDGFKRYYCRDDIESSLDKKALETRQRIYETILRNPGIHQAGIAHLLTMRKSLAEYHLIYLEKNKAILAIKENGYKRYYLKGADVDNSGRQLLGLVRQEIPSRIVLLLLKNQILQHKDLVEQLNMAPSTISYHLNKLLKQGVIEVCKYGEDKGYSLTNKKELMKFLVKYEVHSVIDSFKDMWDQIY